MPAAIIKQYWMDGNWLEPAPAVSRRDREGRKGFIPFRTGLPIIRHPEERK